MKIIKKTLLTIIVAFSFQLKSQTPFANINFTTFDSCISVINGNTSSVFLHILSTSSGYSSLTWTYTGSPNVLWGGNINDTDIALEYSVAGTYFVAVDAYNSSTNQHDYDTLKFNLFLSPTVSWTTSGIICTGNSISFNTTITSGSSPTVNGIWNFGNASPALAYATNTTYVYDFPGTYTVTFYTSDTKGCYGMNTKTLSLTTNTNLANINFVVGCPCNSVQFNATGTAIMFHWDFNDGTPIIMGSSVTHTFEVPDQYLIRLTGTDANGCKFIDYEPIDICPNDSLWNSKSDVNWVFPNNKRVQFNPSPNNIGGTTMSNSKGCAAVSDPVTGNLLFYTNGAEIRDAAHNVMPNGSGLITGTATPQNVLIIPYPGNINRYYVFTHKGHFHSKPHEYRYSVVDMTLNGGMGDVVPGMKNLLLASSSSNDVSNSVLAGVVKRKPTCSNPGEYWLITCASNNSQIEAYLINSSGIQAPIISKIGNFFSYGFSSFATHKSMFANISHYYGGIQWFDFNYFTGQFSRRRFFSVTSSASWGYGSEFSHNSKYLYATTWMGNNSINKLIQIDITHPYAQTTLSYAWGSGSTNFINSIRLAPDRKIYGSRAGGFLCVINNPDIGGAGCGFVYSGLSIGTSNQEPLQNIVPYWKRKNDPISASFTYTSSSSCLTHSFTTLSSLPNYTNACSFFKKYDTINVLWNFGDGNTSNLLNPVHTYTSAGTYTVTLTVFRPLMCTSNTYTSLVNCSVPLSINFVDINYECQKNYLNFELTKSNFTDIQSLKLYYSSDGNIFIDKKFTIKKNDDNGNVVLSTEYEQGYYKFIINKNENYITLKNFYIPECTTEIKFFPNPFNDYLFFQSNVKNIKIIDMFGRLIFEGTPDLDNKVNLSNLSKGVYLIFINDKYMYKISKI
ncbi:MAG: PKD domain-containing protein [Bacteroidia bacterium]|nr:PKD domain-containing protein [Bacteroidia bacterium]